MEIVNWSNTLYRRLKRCQIPQCTFKLDGVFCLFFGQYKNLPILSQLRHQCALGYVKYNIINTATQRHLLSKLTEMIDRGGSGIVLSPLPQPLESSLSFTHGNGRPS